MIRKPWFVVILSALLIAGSIQGQNRPNRLQVERTPADYLFCADGAYDRQKDEGEKLPLRPAYLKKMTRSDFSVLDEKGFYEDPLTGYAGAVFMDLRDSTVILAHRATELGGSKSDMRDVVADAQIAGSDWIVRSVASVVRTLGSAQEADEMLEFGLQYPSAKRLFLWVKAKWPDFPIEQTGHSLGGNITQLLAYEYGTKGVTFDPAGIGNKIVLDTSKWGNAASITNYKIHRSMVGASVTTGRNIGKTVTIYPTDGKQINATQAHGLYEIYSQAIDPETGYFKTFDAVARELWENNGSMPEVRMNDRMLPERTYVRVQDKFESYSAYKRYLKALYGIRDEPESGLFDVPAGSSEVGKNGEKNSNLRRLYHETDLVPVFIHRLILDGKAKSGAAKLPEESTD